MVLQRIKAYIDYKGIKVAAFEKSIGMSNASFGKSLKNNGTIGADRLEIILNTYPDLNPTWLLTGQGDMLQGSPAPTPATITRAPVPSCPLCHEKDKVIQAQQHHIDTLQRELHHCKALYDEERDKGHHHTADGQKRKAG